MDLTHARMLALVFLLPTELVLGMLQRKKTLIHAIKLKEYIMKKLILGSILAMLLLGGNLFAFVEWQEKYQITTQDATVGSEYYLYTTREDDSFYIMHTTSTGVATDYRYACGVNSDYEVSWSSHASINYFTPADCWKSANLIDHQ